MYTLSTQTYLDTYDKIYKKIIVINPKPVDNSVLNTITRELSPPKLSPFESTYSGTSYCASRCITALTTICDKTQLMTPDDIPDLFNYLICNGCTINTNITQMMQTSKVAMSREILCFITV